MVEMPGVLRFDAIDESPLQLWPSACDGNNRSGSFNKEGEQNALDDFCNSAGAVAPGPGHGLYVRRVRAYPAGPCGSCAVVPTAVWTPGRLKTGLQVSELATSR